jgi:chemotaxis response regulator CheB
MELNEAERRRDVVVIGASAGGLEPMLQLVTAIPAKKKMPIIVAAVLHRSRSGFRSSRSWFGIARTGW